MVSGDNRADVVAEASPVELRLVTPAPDAHDQSQGTVLLSQVLEPVVVEIAPEPDGPQDEDRPVLHPGTAAVGTAHPIDILSDGIEQGIAQGGLGVNVLQGGQDGDDLVSAGGVEADVEDGSAVEAELGIEGDSHGADLEDSSLRTGRRMALSAQILRGRDKTSRAISEGKCQKNQAQMHFPTDTSETERRLTMNHDLTMAVTSLTGATHGPGRHMTTGFGKTCGLWPGPSWWRPNDHRLS